MYKKIYRSMCAVTLTALVISSLFLVLLTSSLLAYAAPGAVHIRNVMLILAAAAAISCALIYLLSSFIASALTKSIVKPLEDSYSYEQDAVYDELEPFLSRINNQGREIKRQENKVKEQKMRLRAISENMSEGMIIVDRAASILSVNKCALELFGAEGRAVKHKHFSELTNDTQLLERLNMALSGEKLYTTFEKNAKIYQVFYSPVYEKEEIAGVVILLIDVSERMKTEQIRREFSANVSHELKTPLTAIHGYSQIITGGLAKDGDIIGFAERIEKESLRMINLIDDIIKLSRLDEQADAPQKENISLRALCLDTVSKLQSKAERRGITVSVSGGEGTVHANKIQISEMLYNLIDNAIKYNVENGEVSITVTDDGFVVSDTGIGIDPQYSDRIFERFFRADKSHSKSIGGTGLGLSIVKHVAICNNAEIDVKSTPGEGSVFTVSFKNNTDLDD